MASNLNDKTNENLTREELINKLKYVEESVVRQKDRVIQGQNNTIQTLTAQNFLFRDLLKKVLEIKAKPFDKEAFINLQEIIREKLKERSGKRQMGTIETLTEQNVTLHDLVEQLLNLKIGIFSIGKLTKLQEYARKKLDEIRGISR